MKKTLAWTAVILALAGAIWSAAPDIKRYIKISTM
jgi:hypothetical protein